MNSSNTTTWCDEDFVHRLINAGASLLETRKYEMAIAVLHRALSAQKAGVRRSAAGVTARKPVQHHHCVQHRRNNENLVRESQYQGVQLNGSQCCSSSKTTSFDFWNLVPSTRFVYKQPIYVPPGSVESYNSDGIQGIMSVAIVFNLALAHHLAGLEELVPKDANILLTKSLRLYDLAQQLVLKQNQEYEQDASTADQETTSFLELFNIVHLLGASNNIAQVHKQLGHHDVANRQFQQLLSSVVYLIHGKTTRDGDLSEATVLRPLMEALFQSASHLVLKKYAADAA
jgi:hypothetical protein